METTTEVKKKPFYKKKWVWVVAIILLVIIAASGDSKQKKEQTQTTPETQPAKVEETAIEVTANKIISDYKANEVAADGTYKDKLVKVTGTVGSIAKDVLNNPYVTLTDGNQYSLESVQCLFDKADESKLTSITKDTRITLQGRVSGKSLTNVLLKECELIE